MRLGADKPGLAGLFLDTFAECKTRKARDPDRRAGLALCLLHRLRDALCGIVNVGLVEQADLFVEGLESRLDDLADHGLGLSLSAKFVGKHALLTRHDGRVEA